VSYNLLSRRTAAPAPKAKSPSIGLRIGEPNDSFEQEADHVADEVMAGGDMATPQWSLSRMRSGTLLQRKCACGGSAGPDGECAECKKKEGTIQRRATRSAEPASAPPIVYDVLRSPGQPFDAATRAFMEARFGHDFGQVRLHTDGQAAESVRAVDALAYTWGSHVVFRQGAYSPTTYEGSRLIAHELTHVIQQSGAEESASISHMGAELEADAAAAKVTPHLSVLGKRPVGLACSPGPQSSEVPLTDMEMLKILVDQRAFAFSEPGQPVEDPAGVGRNVGPQAGGRKAGDAVLAIVQITDRNGKLVDRSVGAYFGGGDKHAEPQALTNLERSLVGRDIEGGEMIVVVDQNPCPPGRRDCAGLIEAFARRFKLRRRIRVPTRPSVKSGAGQGVGPRTAARGAQRTDFPAIELRDFHPGEEQGSAPSSQSSPAKSSGPSGKVAAEEPTEMPKSKLGAVTAEKAIEVPTGKPGGATGDGPVEAPKGTVGTVSGEEPIEVPKGKPGTPGGEEPIEAPKGGGVATGVAVVQLGLTVALMFIDDPVEQQVIQKGLSEGLNEPKWQGRLKELQSTIQQAKGDIYYNIRFSTWYVASQSPAVRAHPTQYSVKSVEILGIDVSSDKKSECAKLDPPGFPSNAKVRYGGGYYWDAQRICTTSSQAESGEQAQTRREQEEKTRAQAQLEKRQGELAGQLRKQAAKLPAEPNTRDTPKPQTGPAPLLPTPGPELEPLLPGAPVGSDPIKKAAAIVQASKAVAEQLLNSGTELANRITHGNATDVERRFCVDKETLWRTAVEYNANEFKKNSRPEAVTGMGELLDLYGPKLDQLLGYIKKD